MRYRAPIWLALTLWLSGLAGPGAAAPAGARSRDIADLLPAAGESGGWRADGAPQVFGGKELYGYMDGGADVVLEYGFLRVAVLDYKDEGTRTITAEVFECVTSGDAYGLYTFKTGSEGEPRPIGGLSRLADYYLNIWKGPYVVTLTGLDESPDTKAGLESIGRAVASRIAAPSVVPGIVSLLPASGRIEGTVKYFRGRLGLFQSLPYFKSDVFGAAAGVKADYPDSLSLFILEYPSAAKAGERLESVRRAFRESPAFSGFAESAGVFEARDAKGRAILIEAGNRFMVLVLDPADTEAGRRLLAAAGERLAAAPALPGR